MERVLARPSTRRAISLRVTCWVLLLGSGLAGCGGASHGLSRSQLIEKADTICAHTDAQAAAASAHIHIAHDPDGPRQAFIKTALATRSISQHGVAALRALVPSSAMKTGWERFLNDVEKEAAAESALLRDAQSENTISAAETQQTLQSVQVDLEAASTEDGLRVCGKAAHA